MSISEPPQKHVSEPQSLGDNQQRQEKQFREAKEKAEHDLEAIAASAAKAP